MSAKFVGNFAFFSHAVFLKKCSIRNIPKVGIKVETMVNKYHLIQFDLNGFVFLDYFSPHWTCYCMTFVSECFGPRDSIRAISRGPNLTSVRI